MSNPQHQEEQISKKEYYSSQAPALPINSQENENLSPFEAFMAKTKLEILQIADQSKTAKSNKKHNSPPITAFKDEASYLIIRPQTGWMLLIEKGEVILSEISSLIGPTFLTFPDIIYSSRSNCYFLVEKWSRKIYRKDIDKKPFYLYLSIDEKYSKLKKLIFSKKNQRLMISTDKNKILFINLNRKKIESTLTHEGYIRDLCLLPEEETHLLILDTEFRLFTYRVFPSNGSQTILSQHSKIEDFYFWDLVGRWTLSVKLVPAHYKDRALVLILTLKRHQFTNATYLYVKTVEIQNGQILNVVTPGAWIDAWEVGGLQCCGFVDDHLIYHTWNTDAEFARASSPLFVNVLGYDLGNNRIKNLEDMVVHCAQIYPSELEKVGENYFFMGNTDKVFELKSSNC